MTYTNAITKTLPPGKYYIGCLKRVSEADPVSSGPTGLPTGTFSSTVYTKDNVSYAKKFIVYSGKIGIVPFRNLHVWKSEASLYGMVYKFTHPVMFMYRNGLFTIGSSNITIDIDSNNVDMTDEKEEDEDEDEEDDDEDEEEDEDDDDEDDEEDDEEDEEDEDDEDDKEVKDEKNSEEDPVIHL